MSLVLRERLADVQEAIGELIKEKQICCTVGEGFSLAKQANVDHECRQLEDAEALIQKAIEKLRRNG